MLRSEKGTSDITTFKITPKILIKLNDETTRLIE